MGLPSALITTLCYSHFRCDPFLHCYYSSIVYSQVFFFSYLILPKFGSSFWNLLSDVLSSVQNATCAESDSSLIVGQKFYSELLCQKGKWGRTQYCDTCFYAWIDSDPYRSQMTWRMLKLASYSAFVWDYFGYFGFKPWKNVPLPRHSSIYGRCLPDFAAVIGSGIRSWPRVFYIYLQDFVGSQEDWVAAQDTPREHI